MIILILCILCFLLCPLAVSAHGEERPRIRLLATGGTIAGRAASDTATTGYKAGALSVDDLIECVPEIQSVGGIAGETISSIDSKDMEDEIWIRLAGRINALEKAGKTDGIVIIHGTDTMEETAWFLELTTSHKVPVVLTGAMRPATALSADGPMNLLNGVRLAAVSGAADMGVLVMMNDTIFSARDVTKGNTLSQDTFRSPEGPLGYMNDGKVEWHRRLFISPRDRESFDVSGLKGLPKVYILYGHAGADGAMVRAALLAGAEGIIYAGPGNGSIHRADERELAEAVKKGIPVVRSSHGGSGSVISAEPSYEEERFIPGGSLNPQKGRILLQLALTKSRRQEEIEKIFKRGCL